MKLCEGKNNQWLYDEKEKEEIFHTNDTLYEKVQWNRGNCDKNGEVWNAFGNYDSFRKQKLFILQNMIRWTRCLFKKRDWTKEYENKILHMVTLQILRRGMLLWRCPIFERRRRKISSHYHKSGIWYARYSIYHLLEFVYISHLGILHFSKFFFIFILSIIPTYIYFINDLIIRSSTNRKFLFLSSSLAR